MQTPNALRRYRTENGLTLDDAARALAVSAASISRIETGRNYPSASLMRRITEWTSGNVTPNDLFGLASAEHNQG